MWGRSLAFTIALLCLVPLLHVTLPQILEVTLSVENRLNYIQTFYAFLGQIMYNAERSYDKGDVHVEPL